MILQIFLTIVILINGIIIRNMYRREKKYEELIREQASYMKKFSQRIRASYEELVELDRIGAFQSDDETGKFFEVLKSSFEGLNQVSVGVDYGETEKE